VAQRGGGLGRKGPCLTGLQAAGSWSDGGRGSEDRQWEQAQSTQADGKPLHPAAGREEEEKQDPSLRVSAGRNAKAQLKLPSTVHIPLT